MPRAYLSRAPQQDRSFSRVKEIEYNDYSKGIATYVANDVQRYEYLRLAQDARMPTLGEYETRKGLDFHSDAAGEAQTDSQTSTTGAADRAFSETTRLAQVFTTGTAGRLTKVEVNLKNTTSATGTVMVCIYSLSGGNPSTLLATSSIDASSITSSYQYLTARFVEAPLLTTATNYAIVCYIQTTGTNSYSWSSTSTGTNALTSSNSGSTWSSTSYELNFRAYLSTDGGTKGLFRGYKTDGTKVTLFVHGTTLYSVNNTTGALTTVKSGLSASATEYSFVKINDIIYYCNGFDGIRKWNFTTESQVSSVNAYMLVEHKGMLFYVDKLDPNKVVFSNFGEYEVFTSTDFVLVPSPKTGDPVTSIESLNGSLVIFTRWRKYILYGTDNATYQLEEAAGKKGTYGMNTTTSDRNYVYFLSDDGVYRFNGTEDVPISTNIHQDIMDMPNKSKVCMGVNKGRLYLWHTPLGQGANSKCIVFNLGFSSVESFDTMAYIAWAFDGHADDNTFFVASSLVGQVYLQEQSSNTSHALGAPLDYDLRTHHMTHGSAARPKAMRYWKPRFETQDGNYKVTCEYAYDLRDNGQSLFDMNVQSTGSIWGSGIIWGAFTWGASAETQGDLAVPGEYRRIQIRYHHKAARQPHKFLGHTFVVHTRSLR